MISLDVMKSSEVRIAGDQPKLKLDIIRRNLFQCVSLARRHIRKAPTDTM